MQNVVIERTLNELRPGLEVYLQGGVGEPLVVREILGARPTALEGVRLTSSLPPQMNEFDYAALWPGADLTVFMPPAALRASFEARRVRAFEAEPPFDLAIFQVTPPDVEGMCGFGPCTDFATIVWPRARGRLAFVSRP